MIEVQDLVKHYSVTKREGGFGNSVRDADDLRRVRGRALPDWRLGIAAPVIALLGLWLSHRFWQFALRHYTSASS